MRLVRVTVQLIRKEDGSDDKNPVYSQGTGSGIPFSRRVRRKNPFGLTCKIAFGVILDLSSYSHVSKMKRLI